MSVKFKYDIWTEWAEMLNKSIDLGLTVNMYWMIVFIL